jgi:hypothetical protein
MEDDDPSKDLFKICKDLVVALSFIIASGVLMPLWFGTL